MAINAREFFDVRRKRRTPYMKGLRFDQLETAKAEGGDQSESR